MNARRIPLLAAAIAVLGAPDVSPLQAQGAVPFTYEFDVLYFGNGTTALGGGSDTPTGTMLEVGDSFLWNITAQSGGFWDVVTGGDFFPLMAFQTAESGIRNGDWTLSLFRGGSSVFSTSEVGSEQSCLHVGTNGIALSTGLQFDRMELQYLLNSANETDGVCGGSSLGPPIETTLASVLPIFGAPEENPFSPGISYETGPSSSVPEPSTLALLVIGLAGLRVYRRQH